MMQLYLYGIIALISILLVISLIAWYKLRQAKRALRLQLLDLSAHKESGDVTLADRTDVEQQADIWFLHLQETIIENLDNPYFNVDRLAELLGVSRTTLYRLVHEKAQVSANQLIQELRLQQAYKLLESRQFTTLNQVADAVGFRSADYFSRLYRARFGKSPVQYLQKHKLV